jgi:hypothetical protein
MNFWCHICMNILKHKQLTDTPTFFQDWFAAFPEPEPANNDLTDSESEADSELSNADVETGINTETVESGSKQKWPGHKSKAKKQIKKVCNSFYVRPHNN